MTIEELDHLVVPRARVIIDNDLSGDPDGLVQLAHHVLSPSVEIRGVIGSHLRPGDPFDPSDRTAQNAADAARLLVGIAGRAGRFPIVAGSDTALTGGEPAASDGVRLIIDEAMRDSDLPLYVACGAGLTELASAWLTEPEIADRLTLVWIGGTEHEHLAAAPPGSTGLEYNLAIDPAAAQIVFGDSTIPIWQVPRDAYRQTLLSTAEMLRRLRPAGDLGRHLFDAVQGIATMAGAHGVQLGETYIMGDSPLVLLTALQSAFEADPSSSRYETMPTPAIGPDGRYLPRADARPMRVYTRLDTRLMFEDLFAKLELAAG